MRISSSLTAIAVACLLATGYGNAAYGQTTRSNGQTTRFNCVGVEAECLISETPVPGVRIVREKDYPKRPAHYLSSNLYTTLAAARETNDQFVSFDFIVPAGGGPLPHTHKNEWETFFVEEGTVSFTVGVESTPPYNFIEEDVHAGTVVYGSQGPIHGFINKSGKPARIFSFAMPAGLDNFFHVSGKEVEDWNAPIPPITLEEILRTAFWAEQRGDSLHIPNTPAPLLPPYTPDHVISSITDLSRQETGPFGEKRVVLLQPTEVGSLTGTTAFCGPGAPFPIREGGSVKYSYLSLPNRTGFGPTYISQNTEVFYTLDGSLSFRFDQGYPGLQFAGKVVTVEPRTFIQIDPGIPFTIANRESRNGERAQSLAISVISPICPPSPFFVMP